LTLSAITERVKIFTMTAIRLSGSQLHAARVLVGLSREKLAERAGLCRDSIRRLGALERLHPGGDLSHLCRVVDVLESEGARFSGDGVSACLISFDVGVSSRKECGLSAAALARASRIAHGDCHAH
jgi:hypothetical protein